MSSKTTRAFSFTTPISNYKGTVIAYASISGLGYMHNAYVEDFKNQECEPDDIFSFDVDKVSLMVGTETELATMAYRVSKNMLSDLADAIDKATLAHMEYLFSEDNKEVEQEHTTSDSDARERNPSLDRKY